MSAETLTLSPDELWCLLFLDADAEAETDRDLDFDAEAFFLLDDL